MVAVEMVSGALSGEARAERLFNGDILIFKDVPGMRTLCDYADVTARKAFGGADPTRAHHELSQDAYLAIVEPLQRQFTNDSYAADLFYRALGECGVAFEETYCDWFPMRFQPGPRGGDAMSTSGLHMHRDTWYANVYAQQNWWAPLYPLSAERSIAFFPRFFDHPIKNNSAGWDLEEFRTARKVVRARSGDAKAVRDAYPAIAPQEPIDPADQLVFVVEPGDLLCFSPAHLHATVPNATDRARISTELRTVWLPDVMAGRSAPNVDGASTSNSLGDFYRMSDRAPLLEVLSAR
jgi:hypothetical protein